MNTRLNLARLAAFGLSAVLLSLVGCGKKQAAEVADSAAVTTPAAQSGKQDLNLYIWSEYIDPEILTNFEKEYNCNIVVSLYESNEEMMGKLQAGGVSQYDIVVPSDFIMQSLINLKLLKEIDHAQVPNVVNLKDNMANPPFDPGNKFSIGYQWGTVGICYDKTKFQEPVTSWTSLFTPAEGIKFMYFDSEREMIGGALRYNGYSVNSLDKAELMKAAETIVNCKKLPGFMGFEGNVGGLNKVVAGAVDIAVCYNGDALRAMGEHENIGFAIPKEGTVVWLDSLCIPREAPNAALAMKFINYLLDAKVGAQLSNFNQYATPNKASLEFITPADLANPAIYPNAEVEKRLEYVQEVPNGGAIYGELWKGIKTR